MFAHNNNNVNADAKKKKTKKKHPTGLEWQHYRRASGITHPTEPLRQRVN